MEVTLGGDRLGSGNKDKVYLRNYERSTHDLGYTWRSTMASGTLVPFMSEIALPGDSFDIDLDCDIMTHPTIGPLFGSYKIQLDVFKCPIRLYNGKLHMNLLGIGLDMSKVTFPKLSLTADNINPVQFNDNEQINASSILSYLNIRGLGYKENIEEQVERDFNGIPFLAYWDIYKNYYANKQEEIGYVIHNNQDDVEYGLINNEIAFFGGEGGASRIKPLNDNLGTYLPQNMTVYANFSSNERIDLEKLIIHKETVMGGYLGTSILNLWSNIEENYDNGTWIYSWNFENYENPDDQTFYLGYTFETNPNPNDVKPRLVSFPLDNIDQMRKNILKDVDSDAPFDILNQNLTPYEYINRQGTSGKWSKQSVMEGLGIKTYQSDLFNNWISTEWIDGENGINSITAIDTSDGNFTIDTLLLSRKVYDMLNRIAISGGSYDDWLNATFTHERTRSEENPVYVGGLIKELAFQEVISNAETADKPLGTLAGRGVLTGKHKGGKINVKADEPCYVIGIVSLTPRIDYSQGNKWDVNLKNMNDLHKPALDEIGYQDLITDQMHWADTKITGSNEVVFRSAGKQPAWINYMTNVNQVRGNFADEMQQMYMTLNRRYETDFDTENGSLTIKDLTTYIDPSKFNHIFADTRLDAQNFWAQIRVNNTARRKMSAKVMPNL